MKLFALLLLAVGMWLPSFAQKDAIYWNKMANGMSQALIKNFGELILKVILNVIILIMAVTYPI